MTEKLTQNDAGITTDADALVFLGISSEPMERGSEKRTWIKSMCVFIGDRMQIKTWKRRTDRNKAEEYEFYDLVSNVLMYCHRHGAGSVDIVYEAQAEYLWDWEQIFADTPAITYSQRIKKSLKEYYREMDICFYRESTKELDQNKIKASLCWNQNRHWLAKQETAKLFLMLIQELAFMYAYPFKEEYDLDDVRKMITEAAALKCVSVAQIPDKKLEDSKQEWENECELEMEEDDTEDEDDWEDIYDEADVCGGYQLTDEDVRESFEVEEPEKGVGVEDRSRRIEEIVKQRRYLSQLLNEKIIGQDAAVRKFVDGFVSAKLSNQTKKNKPAAVYLLAGPPGVGKTYLACTAAEALDLPFKIFDMSEYAGIHSTQGLVGFEKTWEKSQPGALTSYVKKNPSCVLLFDEIEKAHVEVQLLFLQILEGARLQDKYDNEYVDFQKVIVIFTTNCGKLLYRENEEKDLSTIPDREILDALREDSSFPHELCSRFAAANIVMFNHVQPHSLCDIARSNMRAAMEELKSEYQIEVSYDQRLAELFLLHMGSGVDARIVSGRSVELLKNSIVAFINDAVEKRGELEEKKIAVQIQLEKENREVYSLFEAVEEQNILVISEDDCFSFDQPGIRMYRAADENETVRLLRENKFLFIVVDLLYGMEDGERISNALGMSAEGRKCFDAVKEKVPQIPVYVIEQESYGNEDKKDILSAGARGFFKLEGSRQECVRNIEKLIQQIYIQKNLKLLSEKRQTIDYQIRYFTKDQVGVVEFCNLTLRDADVSDVRLRRKAKKSRIFDFERPDIRFSDIIGAKQAKKEFQHFIQYMHNIDKYVLEGAERPRGVLLYGPPGTGKTSLAKAFAGECNAVFLNTTGAGIQNSNNPVQEIKDLFQIAYANAPAILFIDEIDVIAKERTGHDTAMELLVNTLLTEMEGFRDMDPFKPVLVVAATNYNVAHRSGYPNEVVIDPALVRRFDNPVYVGLPDRSERKQYLQVLLRQKKYIDRISEAAIDYAAEHTGGKSLAFLKRAISNMINTAIDENRPVNDDLLTDILETQLFGEKRENDEKYREVVARHEAGHAYVAFKTGREPRFITVVSRGSFGGYVSYGAGEDVHNMSRDDFLNHICQALAGRAAEMVYYGESGINTGAQGDLEKATRLVLQMICSYGMGSLGLLSLNPDRILDSPKGAEILEEADRILKEQLERACRLIREGQTAMERIVYELMDKSYIQHENLMLILEEAESENAHRSSGRKHKKWYVVVNGRKPGIYNSWKECLEQVKGYSNAIYRSYETEEEAAAAFSSSRVGMKNIQEKKLLYHLVSFQELKRILVEGLNPDECFVFHPYAPEAQREKKEHPDTLYAYLCITREYASRQGGRVFVAQQEQSYSFEEGIEKIDWKKMEHENTESCAFCVMPKSIPPAEIACIYLPDAESAELLQEFGRETGCLPERKRVITVNKRIFL